MTLDNYSGAGADVERGGALSSAFRTARALADSGLAFVGFTESLSSVGARASAA